MGISSDSESSNMLPEEGMVYKCVSLVEAIAAFDDETYNEEEDKDYLTPKERDLKLIQEIGPGDNCASLVEAITAFDDETYNEIEDEDYSPPENALDASDDGSNSDSETSEEDSDPDTSYRMAETAL